MTGTPVVFIHGLWLHATSWAAVGRPVQRSRVRADRAGLAGRCRHGGEPPGRTRTASPTTASTTSPRTTRRSSTTLPAKPILIGHSFGGMIAEKLLGQDYGGGRDRHRRRADQGRAPAAAVRAALDPAGVQEPRQQAQGGLPDRRAVPLRLRQRRQRARSPTSCTSGGRSRRRASRCSRRRRRTSLCTPRPRSTPTTKAAGRCCSSWAARTTPCPRRSPRRPEAVPAFLRRHRARGVPGPGPLPDHRQRLARGRRRRAWRGWPSRACDGWTGAP